MIALLAIIGGLIALWIDVRRRRLRFANLSRSQAAMALDLASTAMTAAIAVLCLAILVRFAFSQGVVPLRSPAIFGLLVSGVAFAFLWREGLRQIQFQRPHGIIVAEALILGGIAVLVGSLLFRIPGAQTIDILTMLNCIGGIAIGCVILSVVLPPFVKKGAEYHAILEHVQEQGESVQTEYTPPTPECPNPELWHMADSQSTEIEVLDFLKALVITIKPQLIVETGTFLGYGAIALAQGLKANGFGRLITIEFDPAIYAKAKERIAAAGLSDWVEARNESSTETKIDGTIDLLFSDSALAIREQEIRRLLPQVSPHGLIAIHDASSHFKIVREAALRMEKEGLISVVMLPTPRGLVLAQKRDSRS